MGAVPKFLRSPSGTVVERKFIKIILNIDPDTDRARLLSVAAVRSIAGDEKPVRLWFGPLPEAQHCSSCPDVMRAAAASLLLLADEWETDA